MSVKHQLIYVYSAISFRRPVRHGVERVSVSALIYERFEHPLGVLE